MGSTGIAFGVNAAKERGKQNTCNGVDLLDTAHSSGPVVRPDPYYQFVPSCSGHLVEELQALLIPLGVEDTRLQQGAASRFAGRCVKPHEVARIWNQYTMRQMNYRDDVVWSSPKGV